MKATGLLLLILLSCSVSIDCATIQVIGDCSLAKAIENANGGTINGDCTPGDTDVGIVNAIEISTPSTEVIATLVITRSVNITGIGTPKTIDGNEAFRIFQVTEADVHVTFTNLVLQNGFDDTGDASAAGAVLGVAGAKLTFIEVTFLNNKAILSINEQRVAGAILSQGELTADQVTFEGNEVERTDVSESTSAAGIAHYGEDHVEITQAVFTGNLISGDGDVSTGGIGIFGGASANISLSGSGNVGTAGGMIYFSEEAAESFVLATGNWELNTADYSGGVIHHGSDSGLDINLGGFSATGNKAELGGVVSTTSSLTGSAEVVLHSGETLSGNSATEGGGVVFSLSTTVVISDMEEISGNFAPFGGVMSVHGANGRIFDVRGGLISPDGMMYGGIMSLNSLTGGPASSTLTLEAVQGDISGSVSHSGGVMYCEGETSVCEMIDIVGDITDSSASLGGVIFSEGNAIIRNITGNIIGNTASDFGGVMHAEVSALIEDIKGNIIGSSAKYGGVVSSNGEATLNNLEGDIIDSVASNAGGVMFSSVGLVTMENIFGNIINSKSGEGGVIYSGGNAIMKNIAGNIEGSQADKGGVLRCVTCEMENINGNIINSKAIDGEGGVMFSMTSGTISNLIGNIEGSTAENGGVIYSPGGDAVIENMEGDIIDSHATEGNGGVIYCENGNVHLKNITGNISGSRAQFGGVVFSRGDCVLDEFQGDITDSEASNNGGVIFSIGETSITNFFGNIVGSIALENGGVVYSVARTAIENFKGNITDSEARIAGGVIYAEGNVEITTVKGFFIGNEASSGGVSYSKGDTIVQGVYGFESNEALELGGVFYSETSIEVNGVGMFLSNQAKNGGVAYALSVDQGNVNMENICSVTDNIATATGSNPASVIYASGEGALHASEVERNEPEESEVFNGATNDYAIPEIVTSGEITGTITITGSNIDTGYVGLVEGEGGMGTLIYDWYNGDTDATSPNIRVHDPSVVIRDATYCLVTITHQIPLPEAKTGASETVCPSEEIRLDASGSTTGPSDVETFLSYQWEPSAYIEAQGANPEISNPAFPLNSTMTFQLTVTDLLTDVSDQTSVTYRVPSIVASAGPDIHTCEGLEVQLGGSPTAQSDTNLDFIYSWSPVNGGMDGSSPNPILIASTTQQYNVTVSSTMCPGYQVETGMTVFVGTHPPPDIDAAPVPGQSEYWICKGESLTLGGHAFGYATEMLIEWIPADGLNDSTILHPSASPSQDTNYTMRAQSGCGIAFDSVQVNVWELVADAGRDLLDFGRLGGRPTVTGGNPPYSYSWSPSSGLDLPHSANPYATPDQSTRYNLVITDSKQCVQRNESVNVVVTKMSTAGAFTIDYRFSERDFPSLEEAEIFLMEMIGEMLDIPPIAVGVQTLFRTGDSTYTANVVIYQWNQNGAMLVTQFKSEFDCTDTVPCMGNVSVELRNSTDLVCVYFPDTSLGAREGHSGSHSFRHNGLESINPVVPDPRDDDDVPVVTDFTVSFFPPLKPFSYQLTNDVSQVSVSILFQFVFIAVVGLFVL